MLKNRSRAVTSNKQNLMADHSSQQSHSQTHTRPTSSFLSSPKFKGFITQILPGNEAVISPSSVLDTRSISALTNPFWYDRKNHLNPPPGTLTSPRETFSPTKHPWEESDSGGNIGLKLIDSLEDETVGENSPSKPCNKKVLRVQIPPLSYSPKGSSPKSPAGFGIKTRNSQESGCGSESICSQTEKFSQCASATEMELSEDYTCVIKHGPNPRKTHIFDNCVVESYCSLSNESNHRLGTERYFLSFCHTCKKPLQQTDDIYIYRGEKAFCSQDCRHQEMVADGEENSEFYS